MLAPYLPKTVITLAALLAACSPPGAARRDIPETSANDCTFFRSLYDWRALDDENLVVWGPSRQPYQVTLNFPSTELRFTESLIFVDGNNDGRLCGFGMDAVVIADAIPPRVTIGGMRRLTEAELAALLDGNADTLGELRTNATDEQPGQG